MKTLSAQFGRLKAGERIDAIMRSDVFKSRLFRPETLHAANRYLVIISAVLFVYLIAESLFVRPRDIARKKLSAAAASPGRRFRPPAGGRAAGPQMPPDLSLVRRPIFGRIGPAVVRKEIAPEDLSADLGLVGMIPGDAPQAIIENRKTQKTYYVREGGSFEHFVVEKIEPDRVILDYEGKRVELFL